MILMRNGARVLACAAVALLVSAGLFGQEQTRKEKRDEAKLRSVTGMVVNAQEQPVSGAVVQLKDMHTLQVRSFITQSDGGYKFFSLRPDIDYQVTARFGDMTAAARTLSIFDTRKEAVMNFKLDKPEKK
ncbi:MAG: carboxypeptidase-like regulatory domain-containing protein [Acidobacteriota bacterium]|nr:carboxypeptidase-like regulatory domain-containing protein [Acidobacteriota bacterium]